MCFWRELINQSYYKLQVISLVLFPWIDNQSTVKQEQMRKSDSCNRVDLGKINAPEATRWDQGAAQHSKFPQLILINFHYLVSTLTS